MTLKTWEKRKGNVSEKITENENYKENSKRKAGERSLSLKPQGIRKKIGKWKK